MRLDFRLLGPVEVVGESGQVVDLGSRKQRAVLALLLAHAPRVVPLDQIIDFLWREEPPSSATGTLQAYIFQIRKALEPGRSPRTPARVLRTLPPGYLLDIDPAQIDAHRFLTALEEAQAALAAGHPEEAERLLNPALAAWRGEPYADLPDEEYLRPAVAHLTEARLAAVTTRAEARLALGRAGEVAVEVERLLESAPYREGLWSLLIRALYADRRQADALAAYQRCRTLLDEELGLLPSPELRALEQAVLRQEEAPTTRPVATLPVLPEPGPALPRLVGRAPHLRRLHDRIADAARGSGGVLLVGGEAGIGKTTLAEAAADLAAEQGFTTVWSRCAEDAPAFWPWIQALRRLDPDSAERLAAPGKAADPDAARFLLHDAVARALERKATDQPIMIVLEDAHWADAATLKLLTFLGADLHRVPLLVLVTVRHDPAPQARIDAFAELARQRGTERLTVGPLTAADVAAYLDGRDERLREHVGVLHDRTGGNPFYLGELLRLAASTRSADIAALPVPDGVRDVIAQRVSRLPEDTQALLRAASVVGREVGADVLASAAGIDAARLLLLLEPAVATGLLVEVDGGWDHSFSHALVQETLYGELTRLQRAQLHGRIGAAIESLGGGDPDRISVLAHHFAQAARVGHGERAVSYAVKAAEQAAAGLAYDEAVRYWELALACLGPAGTPQRCRLLIELGRARRLTGDVIGARAPLDEAVDLGTRLGEDAAVIEAASVFGGVTLWNWRSYGSTDPRMIAVLEDQLARLPADDLARRAELLGTLAVELYYGERTDGLALATEAVELARRTGDPLLLAQTLNNYVIAAWSPDTDAERFTAAAEILTLPGLPRLTEVISRLHRMQGLMQDGELADYDAELARCLRLTAELRIPEIAAQVNYAASGRATLQGDRAEARRLSALATEWYRRTSLWGPDVIELISDFYAGWTAGDRDSGLLGTLVSRAGDPSDRLVRPTAILAALESGDPALARELVARWGVEIPRDWTWQFVAWQWGLIAARLGQPDPEAMLGVLLPVAGQIATLGTGCVSWGSIHEAVAELYAATGDLTRARDHATAAAATHRRLAIPHLERRSQALLDRLSR
ncbi:BTAD domain-containing putative transcriptional regulator [Acrocarpospora catenulata]|uniref:BTAD domain-containing putative transcriptional regulator n=1 Tax=Acrocarpospora catenulata TaxID=2836182 RepID=UPI001BDB1534|nr:BTAD domain-containing putative transcriptional regulator [Acrocarpospora catenulata]